jgi:hypothetical protein
MSENTVCDAINDDNLADEALDREEVKFCGFSPRIPHS